MRKLTSAVLIACAGAMTAGCGSSEILSGETKPFANMSLFSTRDWSSPTSAAEMSLSRNVTAEDYVDANGLCGAAATAAATTDSAVGTVAGDLGTTPVRPASAAPAPTLGGVGLGMTECQVVQRAGQPSRVDIGAEGTERKAVITYAGGSFPGIYTFVGGRLKVVDAVPTPEPVKQAPKKRSAKPRTAAR